MDFVAGGFVNREPWAVSRWPSREGTGRWTTGFGPAPSPRTTFLTVVRREKIVSWRLPALEGPAYGGMSSPVEPG